MQQKEEKCYSFLMSSKHLVLADAKHALVPDLDRTEQWGLPRGLGHAREAIAHSEMETKCQVAICKPDGREGYLFCFKIVMDIWKKYRILF